MRTGGAWRARGASIGGRPLSPRGGSECSPGGTDRRAWAGPAPALGAFHAIQSCERGCGPGEQGDEDRHWARRHVILFTVHAATLPLLLALSPPRAFVTAGGGAELGTFAQPELNLGLTGALTAGATGLPRVWVEGAWLPLRLLSAVDPAPALHTLGRAAVGGAWLIPIQGPFRANRRWELGPMVERSNLYGWDGADPGQPVPVVELGLLFGSGEHGSGEARWQLGLSEEISCNERDCTGAPALRWTGRRPNGLLIDASAGVVQATVAVGYEWGWSQAARDES